MTLPSKMKIGSSPATLSLYISGDRFQGSSSLKTNKMRFSAISRRILRDMADTG